MPNQDAESDRVRIAQLALAAAVAQPGVVRGAAGSSVPCVTATRSSGLLVGVSVVVGSDERYEVDLRLVGELVALVPLADRVRKKITTAARRSGLYEDLGPVNIEFVEVLTPVEIAAQATDTDAGTQTPAEAGEEDNTEPAESPPDANTTPGAGERAASAAEPAKLAKSDTGATTRLVADEPEGSA